MHAKMQLAIRRLIRKEFQDPHPTQNVAWKRGCMFVQPEFPKLVGVALVDDDGLLRYLVVREEFRGKQLGSKMLQHVLSQVSHLTCIPDRIPFYARHGFHVTDEPADVEGMVFMRKFNKMQRKATLSKK